MGIVKAVLLSVVLLGGTAAYMEVGPGKTQLQELLDMQHHHSSCAQDQVNRTLDLFDQAEKGRNVTDPQLACKLPDPDGKTR